MDFGLRDVGVENQPREVAKELGKAGLKAFPLVVGGLFALCVLVGLTGVGAWIAGPLALVLTMLAVVLALRASKRSPMVVVKVSEQGTNQATWALLASLLLPVAIIAMLGGALIIPVAAIAAIVVFLMWRSRGYVPEVLRELRSLLAADEVVLGDGAGRVAGHWNWRDAFRLIVATDRRLLIVTTPRARGPFVVVDAPYADVSRFSIEWKYWGNAGALSLTVADETHAIADITPANLVSIAEALRAQGVAPDDPQSFSAAEHAWEQTQRGGEAQQPGWPRRLFDRTAMNTEAFDRGLWLLLGLAAVTFYVNPFGVGIGMSRNSDIALLVIPFICGICGYVSGTRSALAYIAPLNLLIAPAFFFGDALVVITLMVLVSALAAVGLWVGSALRRATPPSPGERAPRGTLRYTLSGLGLLRLSGLLLALMAAMVASAGAAGVELTSLRLAIEERTFEQRPVDGRSNLTGNAASLSYTPGSDLRELITDEGIGADGAKWELRSSWQKGQNVVSLASYIFEPRLDNPSAVAEFVADKDDEHERLAGESVAHTQRVVDGRKGYVWDHGSPLGYWYYAAWFPHPRYTVRIECIARNEEERFRRLCGEAMRSLRFR